MNEHDLILLDSEQQEIEKWVDKDLKAIDVIQCCKSDSEQLCDCAMPDPIDPFEEVDKDTCRKCENKIA
jgi:hypothetical protein